MSYVRDPYDTPEPPCFCGQQATGPVLTTEEFCPACGDPAKPVTEPEGTCPECHGTGVVRTDGCACGQHEGEMSLPHENPDCGIGPCPNGCPVKPFPIEACAHEPEGREIALDPAGEETGQ